MAKAKSSSSSDSTSQTYVRRFDKNSRTTISIYPFGREVGTLEVALAIVTDCGGVGSHSAYATLTRVQARKLVKQLQLILSMK